MSIVTPKAKIRIANLAIRAANEIIEYKVYLKKLLKHEYKAISLNLSTVDIQERRKEIKKRIEILQKYISTRYETLLNLHYNEGIYEIGEPRVFCEAYSIGNGKYEINSDSYTKSPINQLGTVDINKGYVSLTQVSVKYPYPVNGKPTIILTPIRLDLRTGNIAKGYVEDI